MGRIANAHHYLPFGDETKTYSDLCWLAGKMGLPYEVLIRNDRCPGH
jgi:hypothetical protein